MLSLRSSPVALAFGVATLVGQSPPHASQIPSFPIAPSFHVVQQDDAVHLADFHGLYIRSLDGGRTWSSVPQWLALTAVEDFACGPGLAIAVGIVGNPPIPTITRSTDGGATWQPAIPIGPGPVAYPGSMRVHVDGSTVVVAWLTSSLWFSRSTDGGVTWQATQSPLNWSNFSGTILQMCAAGPSIHLFWYDPLGHSELQQVSADTGLSWLPAPRVRPGGPDGARVARDGNDLYAVNSGTTLSQSHDGGLTWTSAPVPGMQVCDQVACHGQTVLVLGSSTSPTFLHTLNVSTDGGATWQSNPWIASSSTAFAPVVHATRDGLYAFFSTSIPGADLLLHSSDAGTTWRVVQQGIDTFAPGPRRNIHVMQDAVFVGTGYTRTGMGLPGTGAVAPELRLDGLPHLGATTTFVVDGTVGGALGALGFAFAPPAATPLGPATIWLQGPLVLATIVAGGAPGVPGAGSAALPVAIPANPALVNANLNAQALLFDGGAAAGFTVTNAIEVWMR